MRKGYYQDRLESLAAVNPSFTKYAGGMANQLRQAKQPLFADDITRQVIKDHGVTEFVADDFLMSAKSCGLVATDKSQRYFSPIPSFLTHLAEPGRQSRGSEPFFRLIAINLLTSARCPR